MLEIVLMGKSGSGKSSIKGVVFEKLSPYESVFNESTRDISNTRFSTLGFEKISITEIPGNITNDFDEEILKNFNKCKMLIYVVDCQDNTDESFVYFKDKVFPYLLKNPKCSLSVFIHKTDSANNFQGNFSAPKGQIMEKFNEIIKKESNEINPYFYTTSIYDYSLFDAFSKILQKMIKQNSLLCSLLDSLTCECRFVKAYLFDVFTKIYIATDEAPLHGQIFEICSDMIDVVTDMSGIYGNDNENDNEYYFDDNSMGLIKINKVEGGENSKDILSLRFIYSNFVLIFYANESSFENLHFMDRNIDLFRQAVKKILNKN